MADQAQALRQRLRLGSGGGAHPASPSGSPQATGAGPPETSQAAPVAGTSVRRARVLAVTSGKGGVGKTNVTVNLAYALIGLGHRVVVLDGDLGLANVDVLVGASPRYHLGHVLSGERSVREVLCTAPGGLSVIAGGSGLSELVDLPEPRLAAFLKELRVLESEADFLLLDTGAGMGRSVVSLVLAADEVIVVTTPEPTAITDAYALIKAILRHRPAARLSLVVNQVQNPQEGRQTAERLSLTVLRFLGAHLEVLGEIPHDPQVGRAVRSQTPFVLAAPRSAAAAAVQDMARRLAGAGETGGAPRVGLFFDRLLRLFARPGAGG